MTRRWRGTIDVPLTEAGRRGAEMLGYQLPLDLIFHDHLSRCRDTALEMKPQITLESEGPRPWRMGIAFEGQEITPEGIQDAQWYVKHAGVAPARGECFSDWYWHWRRWIERLQVGWGAIGVVTHNRNIQALYSIHNGVFHDRLYNVDGPDFLTIHYYHKGHIAPWNGRNLVRGIYLIRHGETEWGT